MQLAGQAWPVGLEHISRQMIRELDLSLQGGSREYGNVTLTKSA